MYGMMGISWKDKVSNERVRVLTQLEKIDLIIKDRVTTHLENLENMEKSGNWIVVREKSGKMEKVREKSRKL